VITSDSLAERKQYNKATSPDEQLVGKLVQETANNADQPSASRRQQANTCRSEYPQIAGVCLFVPYDPLSRSVGASVKRQEEGAEC